MEQENPRGTVDTGLASKPAGILSLFCFELTSWSKIMPVTHESGERKTLSLCGSPMSDSCQHRTNLWLQSKADLKGKTRTRNILKTLCLSDLWCETRASPPTLVVSMQFQHQLPVYLWLLLCLFYLGSSGQPLPATEARKSSDLLVVCDKPVAWYAHCCRVLSSKLNIKDN